MTALPQEKPPPTITLIQQLLHRHLLLVCHVTLACVTLLHQMRSQHQ
jgi:hypothetical protein